MKIEDGKVVVESNIYKYVPFHIHNKYIGTTFSSGVLVNYNLSGKYDLITKNSFYGSLIITDEKAHYLSTDTLIKSIQDGKFLSTSYKLDKFNINILNFIGTDSKSICTKIEVDGLNDFTLTYSFGFNTKIDNLFKSTSIIELKSNELNTRCMEICEKSINNKVSIILVTDIDDSIKDALTIYNEVYKEASNYLSELNSFSKDNSIKKWALNSSLSLYKDVDGFKSVFAGLDYSSPFRTYYRDSFYTCLSFIKYKPSYVKDEIYTLAMGVNSDYTCSSAVTENYKGWWNNHTDSPLFFILLVNSYINVTNDYNILNVVIKNKTIKDIIKAIIDSQNIDDTGLIIKEENDRRDWADNVYRCGYVTYTETLYYGALKACAKLIDNSYYNKALKVKESINKILWNDKTNALYNFKSEKYQEDNISLDTIFAIIFDCLDNDKAVKLLKTFEEKLETINNKEIDYDYGVACCYPNYKYQNLLTEKSSYPNRYHNGANWPYLSNLYGLCKKVYKMDYQYIIDSFINLSTSNDWTSPFEYYSPLYEVGSLLQGWSSDITLLFDLDNFDIFN